MALAFCRRERLDSSSLGLAPGGHMPPIGPREEISLLLSVTGRAGKALRCGGVGRCATEAGYFTTLGTGGAGGAGITTLSTRGPMPQVVDDGVKRLPAKSVQMMPLLDTVRYHRDLLRPWKYEPHLGVTLPGSDVAMVVRLSTHFAAFTVALALIASGAAAFSIPGAAPILRSVALGSVCPALRRGAPLPGGVTARTALRMQPNLSGESKSCGPRVPSTLALLALARPNLASVGPAL